MLKKLNMPIARCYAEKRKHHPTSTHEDDEQLDKKVLICNEQHVILTCNLWVEAGLVNETLGKVVSIFYAPGSKPPQLPSFVVVDFFQDKGSPWDAFNPYYVPLPPITRGSGKQIPLRMAWGLTIHKLQGMTLPKATMDIGKID